MKSTLGSDANLGRPNQTTARMVHEVLYLFSRGQRHQALALAQQHHIPLDVVERVILRRGPRRKRVV